MLLNDLLWWATGIDRPIPAVGATVASWLGGRVSDEVKVEQVAGHADSAPIAGISGMATAIGELNPDTGIDPGTIRIDEVVQPDGSTGWIVLIPGTQPGWDSSNPMDWATNPEAMVGMPTAGSAMVAQAMRDAGIGADDQVVVAGHSQGGMLAMNVANEVMGEFSVSQVVTFGSPTSLLDAPPGVEVLHVEHIEDMTSGLENTSNAVSEDRTTVQRDLHTSSDPAISDISDVTGSHGIEAYADTGRLIDASDEDAVQDFLNPLAPLFDPDATVESHYFQGTRVE